MDISRIMLQIYKDMEKKTVAQQYMGTTYYERQIRKYRHSDQIVIFGASEAGRRLFFMLKKEGFQSVQAYCDNDRGKQGVFMDDIPIHSPDEAVERYPKALFIVTSILYADEIMEQLSSLGISRKQISLFDICNSGVGE